MNKYRSESWSYQAREMSRKQINAIERGYQTIAGALKFFSNSYRHPKICERAAKHFGRQVRMGKVHENLKKYYEYFPEREERE